ncbi:endonuclease domain-containing protein [Arthrobacter sp. RCC_34]|uniref:endonuclease domain-containing protein n=1 Tax=Arthrobacter sp. RCC_34 TaxID=3239230 RepID=UPI0035234F81
MQRKPLPPELAGGSFTALQARDAGLSRSRSRARDVAVVSRGIRVPLEAGLRGPAALLAYTADDPGAVVMDLTAAQLTGLPLPRRHQGDWRVHLGRPRGRNRARRLNVVGRMMTFRVGEVVMLDGLRITSPWRTWLDLALRLSVDELVVVGDHLVCEHGPEAPVPRRAICTVADLERTVVAHAGMRGVKKARAALDRIRVGADSPQETTLRLLLVDHGFPEPHLNHVLRRRDGKAVVWPDLAYPDFRVSIQYDGGHHGSPGQYTRDIRRQALTEELGWREVRVGKEDLDGFFPRVLQKIRRALVQAGWSDGAREAS